MSNAVERLPKSLSFRGGTVADLVQHIVDHRVSVRYGSRAQLLLSDLGTDLYRNLDQKIAGLEERIENLKSQSAGSGPGSRALLAASQTSMGSGSTSTNSSPPTGGGTGAVETGSAASSESPEATAISATVQSHRPR
jgi:hypothetical protein